MSPSAGQAHGRTAQLHLEPKAPTSRAPYRIVSTQHPRPSEQRCIPMPTNKQTSNLIPFSNTPEGRKAASEAGKRGAAVKAAKRAQQASSPADASKVLARSIATLKRDDLGPAAIAAAGMIVARILTGEIEVTGKNAADLLGKLVEVGRLEAGQATGLNVSVRMSDTEALAHIERLRSGEQLQQDGGIELSQ